MGLDRKAIYLPSNGEIMTLLGTHDNRTVAWAGRVDSAVLKGNTSLSADFDIIGARFETGLDARLRTQKESIDRLLAHLKNHCPALLNAGICSWMEVHPE